MTVEICSCEGLNSNCEKCFGSGYVSSGTSKNSFSAEQKDKSNLQKNQLRQDSFLPDKFELLSRIEIENLVIKIIGQLDLKSKKQMQLLNSIPFNTTTFRRDFKDKFEALRVIELEKQVLRKDLAAVTQVIVAKKYSSKFKFEHLLSDKEIDVTSNRQLKELIREYKKSKNNAG